MSDFWYDHDQQRTVSSAEALDRFAKHIADEVAAAIRAELATVTRPSEYDHIVKLQQMVAALQRSNESLRVQLREISESHAHALESTS